MNNKLKYSLYSLCLTLSLVSSHSYGEITLSPQKSQQITTLEIVKKLEQRHFIDIPIDNKLSQQFLKSFIESIDPNRYIFLKSEVAAFTADYENHLDDKLKRGNLTPAYTMFNI